VAWGATVLTSRLANGRLFDLQPVRAAAPVRPRFTAHKS